MTTTPIRLTADLAPERIVMEVLSANCGTHDDSPDWFAPEAALAVSALRERYDLTPRRYPSWYGHCFRCHAAAGTKCDTVSEPGTPRPEAHFGRDLLNEPAGFSETDLDSSGQKNTPTTHNGESRVEVLRNAMQRASGFYGEITEADAARGLATLDIYDYEHSPIADADLQRVATGLCAKVSRQQAELASLRIVLEAFKKKYKEQRRAAGHGS